MFKKKLCLFLTVFLLFSNGEKLVPVSEVQLLFDQRSSALISGDMKTYNEITEIPTNYDSTYQAVRAFVAGTGVYQSSITSLPVTGVECQTVTTAVLSNPEHPLYAQ